MNETNAARAAGSSAPACSDFDVWWHNEGSGMGPRPDDDMESHARRVAKIAWQNGAYKAKYPTSPNSAICVKIDCSKPEETSF